MVFSGYIILKRSFISILYCFIHRYKNAQKNLNVLILYLVKSKKIIKIFTMIFVCFFWLVFDKSVSGSLKWNETGSALLMSTLLHGMTQCRSCVIGQVGVRNSTSPQTVNHRHSANSSVFEQRIPQVRLKLDTSHSLAYSIYNDLS